MTRSGIVALVGAAMALVGYFLAARFVGVLMSGEDTEYTYELMMLGISLFFAGCALVVIAGIAVAVLWLRARGAPRERSPRRR